MATIRNIVTGAMAADALSREPKLEDFAIDPRDVAYIKKLKIEADRLENLVAPASGITTRSMGQSATSGALQSAIDESNAAYERWRSARAAAMQAQTAAWEKAYDEWSVRQRASQANAFNDWRTGLRNRSAATQDIPVRFPGRMDAVEPAVAAAPTWQAPARDVPGDVLDRTIGPEPRLEDFPLPDTTALNDAEQTYRFRSKQLADVASGKVRVGRAERERIIAAAQSALDDFTKLQLRAQTARADSWGSAHQTWREYRSGARPLPTVGHTSIQEPGPTGLPVQIEPDVQSYAAVRPEPRTWVGAVARNVSDAARSIDMSPVSRVVSAGANAVVDSARSLGSGIDRIRSLGGLAPMRRPGAEWPRSPSVRSVSPGPVQAAAPQSWEPVNPYPGPTDLPIWRPDEPSGTWQPGPTGLPIGPESDMRAYDRIDTTGDIMYPQSWEEVDAYEPGTWYFEPGTAKPVQKGTEQLQLRR
jgi:hypothetical protein